MTMPEAIRRGIAWVEEQKEIKELQEKNAKSHGSSPSRDDYLDRAESTCAALRHCRARPARRSEAHRRFRRAARPSAVAAQPPQPRLRLLEEMELDAKTVIEVKDEMLDIRRRILRLRREIQPGQAPRWQHRRQGRPAARNRPPTSASPSTTSSSANAVSRRFLPLRRRQAAPVHG